MATSRLRRFEERRLKKRLFWAMAGSVSLLVFLALFGLKLLEGFSLTLDKLRGGTPPQSPAPSLILPPTLDPLAEATNSATLTITGKGQPDLMVTLFVNEAVTGKIKIDKDGSFTTHYTVKSDGQQTISAKVNDEKGNVSNLSNVVTSFVKRAKPILEVNTPVDDALVTGNNPTVTVSGKTDEDNTVTVNDRFVLVKNDGSFSYATQLQEGDNTLTIVATDRAGNQIAVERSVKYEK